MGDRARLQEGVFRPTVALPTMTVEQFGVQERERMLEREAKQREAEAEKAAVRAAKEDRAEDESEEDLQKQRAWDDWKDDHPYGSGNSRLRPCAAQLSSPPAACAGPGAARGAGPRGGGLCRGG